ncbi:DUF7344 domain-containing protein [Halorientalis halophila]|uniref:DUF7344 domain-containing protein n=1 Tax=Halorientalis halophila TaxID=3108499 RepID=UPI00300936C6
MNDDTFDALAHDRRRQLLLPLLDEPRRESTATAAVSDGGTDRKSLQRRAGLYHVHLPKLAHYGIIEWHEDSDEISRGPNFEQVRPLLELVADRAA